MTSSQIIQLLQLQPHPEGGFYKETYRSEGIIEAACLPETFPGKRHYSTAIYYLLQKGDFSAFHRIKSDEIWHYYHGGDFLIHLLDAETGHQCKTLGSNLSLGAVFQIVVPAGMWFAAEPTPDSHFTLAGCTVAPGFDFADFEMAEKKVLLQQFPNYASVINRLCR